jgi:hypothetical protein
MDNSLLVYLFRIYNITDFNIFNLCGHCKFTFLAALIASFYHNWPPNTTRSLQPEDM